MKRTVLVLLGLAVVATFVLPVLGRDLVGVAFLVALPWILGVAALAVRATRA